MLNIYIIIRIDTELIGKGSVCTVYLRRNY